MAAILKTIFALRNVIGYPSIKLSGVYQEVWGRDIINLGMSKTSYWIGAYAS